jgi:hypothetical protein
MELIGPDPVCLEYEKRKSIDFLPAVHIGTSQRDHDIVIVPKLKVGVQRRLTVSQRKEGREYKDKKSNGS